jgi:hypothetical protein
MRAMPIRRLVSELRGGWGRSSWRYTIPGIGLSAVGGYLLNLFTVWSRLLAAVAFAAAASLLVLAWRLDRERESSGGGYEPVPAGLRRWQLALGACAWTVATSTLLVGFSGSIIPDFFAAAALLAALLILWKHPELRRSRRRRQ